jgi:hypothetical protein
MTPHDITGLERVKSIKEEELNYIHKTTEY